MDDIELETMNLTWDENFIFLMENWTRLKNMSEEEYLEYQLGPKHLSLSVVVPITVVNNESLTMCTGFNALQFRRVKMRLSKLETCWIAIRVSTTIVSSSTRPKHSTGINITLMVVQLVLRDNKCF
ncbi:hypothetical protein KQX54_020611 [Cotesia glomerata]|uniref:Uncharacterized protein n=1 Tax=Cotesia glomerata TaxID=32391 RepID=A0AAV7IEP7_COTGL|nr:hypothetical protein KQX54_020611 [Cotesia glomerata]